MFLRLIPVLCLLVQLFFIAAQSLYAATGAVDAPDKDGNTPLMLAAQKGDIALMKALLGSGVDLHKRNPRGSNALMFAVDGGLPAIELLLQKGAKATDQRNDGTFDPCHEFGP